MRRAPTGHPMIDPQGHAAEGDTYVAGRDVGEGGGSPRSPLGFTPPLPPVMVSKPRTREEALRLWLTLLVVCVVGAAFYYGLAKLLVALGVF